MAKKRSSPKIKFAFHTVETLRERLEWYVNIRWIAIFGILASIPIGQEMFRFTLAYPKIILLATFLILLNIIYTFFVRFIKYQNEYQELTFAEIQILIDLMLISFLIHYAGGIDNPFFFLYIIQVIFSGILFPAAGLSYLNALIAALLLTCWTLLEHFGMVNQYFLGNEPISLQLSLTSLIAFYVTTFAGVYIISNFMLNYRTLKRLIDEKNLQLEKAMLERNKLFRFTAHEIKSPVTTIKSSLSVVRKLYGQELKPEVNDMIMRAESRSDQVLNMVKEMIEITQYHLATEKPSIEIVHLEKWLNQILVQHQSYAFHKAIHLSLESAKEEIVVAIDKSGLEKVFNNLLNNALRYTPEGGTVVIKPYKKEASFGFAIQDSGIGIAPEEMKNIFSEFYRGSQAKEMEKIGTGLGLNLANEIVKKNSGIIHVESELGKGSIFSVEMPLQEINKTEN